MRERRGCAVSFPLKRTLTVEALRGATAADTGRVHNLSLTIFRRVVCLLVVTGGTALPAAVDPEALAAARARYEARQPDEARAAFERLAAADPAHPEVNHHLGQLANRRDEPELAVRFFEQAIAVEPRAGRHHHGLGDALGRSAQKAGLLSKFGLAKKCVAAYERAVALEPDSFDFRWSLFEYYRQAPGIAGGGLDKARGEAAAMRRIDPVRARAAFALLHAADKDYAAAFAELDAALAVAPDDFVTLYHAGRLAALSGQQVEQGIARLRRCLQLPVPLTPPFPDHAVAQLQLGKLLERRSDPEGARAAYEAALQLDPGLDPAATALRRLPARRNPL